MLRYTTTPMLPSTAMPSAPPSSELGGALGIAVLGSIGVVVYRSMMAQGVPIGVSPEATAVAQATLGGAVAVARQLPDQLGAPLLGAAREAFTRAFELAAAICAAIALLMAPVAMVLLRSVRSSSSP